MLRDIFRLMRVRHWIKNLFVFAPLVFSLNLYKIVFLTRSLVIFAAFCLVSSGVYIFNDLADRERDALHPEKRHRPLAAGRIPVRAALILGIFLVLSGIALGGSTGLSAAAVLSAYLIVNLLYSLALRQQTLLDVMVIALGFLLRIGAGAAALEVELSLWMLLTTFFLALFLAFGKRRNEIIVTEKANEHRRVFRDYSVELLNHLIIITATLTIITYSLYVVSSDTMQLLGSSRFFITIPFVVFGVFRYILLIYRKNMGGDPADVVLRDRAMLIDIILWGAVVLILIGAALYTGGSV